MIEPGGQPSPRVDAQIDIPVTVWNDGKDLPVTTFHFDIPDLEITVPWGGGGSNSYAVQVNGIEMRMPHVIFAPDYTEVRLCYQTPSTEDWLLDSVTAQFGDAPALEPDAGVAMNAQVRVQTRPG